MDNKIIKEGSEKIIEGVNKAVGAIKMSIGPSGKAIAIGDDGLGCQITRDGATIAKNIQFKDKEENIGAELVKKASASTEDDAGDGTSTTALLIQEFCKRGQRALNTGANVNELKEGMLKAGKWVEDYIKKSSISVNGDLDKVEKVATISANNDPKVGALVREAFEKVGLDSLVTAETGNSLDTTIDITTGMKLDKGWSSPQFVTNPGEGKCVLENPYILVADERISSVAQMVPLLQDYQQTSQGSPLLIVCDEMDDAVTAMLLFNNYQGALRCCVVKGLDFGDGRKNVMEDLAVAVGATHICKENGKTITDALTADLGSAKKVVVSRDSAIIYEGGGDPSTIKARAEVIKKRMKDPTTTSFDKTKFSKRLANLTGGVAVIHAGGASEAETTNQKATIEDSILAAHSAIEEGCAPGGGYVYYHASQEIIKDRKFWKGLTESEKDGAEIIVKSLPVVLKTVAENCGVSGDVVLEKMKKTRKENVGFNAKTKKFCNLIDSGVLDSSKVLRIALENSISAASMVLLIGCTMTAEEEKTENKE